MNLEFEDVPYQRFWLPSDRIDPTDRDAKVDNLRSVLRRKFHQLSSLPDNSPSPDLVLALTDAVRYNPICISKLENRETPGPNTKLKRFVNKLQINDKRLTLLHSIGFGIFNT